MFDLPGESSWRDQRITSRSSVGWRLEQPTQVSIPGIEATQSRYLYRLGIRYLIPSGYPVSGWCPSGERTQAVRRHLAPQRPHAVLGAANLAEVPNDLS